MDLIVGEAEVEKKELEIARNENIDVVVLDIMLPGIDGFEVCKILRQEFPKIG